MEELYKISLRGDVKALTDWRTRNSLLPLHAQFTAYRRTPLHIAAMCGHIKFAKELLRIDSRLIMKIDTSGFTPLHLASARQSFLMVKTLLMTDEDVCRVQDQDGRTPLHLAAIKDQVEIINVLYAKKPEAIHIRVNGKNETILHLCIRHNCLIALDSLIRHLQSEGAPENIEAISVNSVNSDGDTILHLAADTRQMECFKYLTETKGTGIETNALNNNDLKARDFLTQIERDTLEIGCHNMKEERRVSKKWLIERVNALMVVATLIAGITFQAAINPPGGVFQEDSKIKATDNPVTFTYYLGTIIGTDMSSGFDDYLDFLSGELILNNDTIAPQNITQAHLKNITKVKNLTEVTSANFINEVLHKFYTESLRYYNPYSLSKSPGIVLEHDKWNTIISKYDRDPRFFSPYLILYAGTPILAYRYPTIYYTYMVSNTIAFVVSLCMIVLVISGFISEVFIDQQVRVLVGLMIVSIMFWFVCYITVFITMSPPFYLNRLLLIGALCASYFVTWICVSLGMWFYRKFYKKLKYWMQVNWKYTRKEILVDQFEKEDMISYTQMPGVSTKITMVLYSIMIVAVAIPYIVDKYQNCVTCNKYQKKKVL